LQPPLGKWIGVIGTLADAPLLSFLKLRIPLPIEVPIPGKGGVCVVCGLTGGCDGICEECGDNGADSDDYLRCAICRTWFLRSSQICVLCGAKPEIIKPQDACPRDPVVRFAGAGVVEFLDEEGLPYPMFDDEDLPYPEIIDVNDPSVIGPKDHDVIPSKDLPFQGFVDEVEPEASDEDVDIPDDEDPDENLCEDDDPPRGSSPSLNADVWDESSGATSDFNFQSNVALRDAQPKGKGKYRTLTEAELIERAEGIFEMIDEGAPTISNDRTAVALTRTMLDFMGKTRDYELASLEWQMRRTMMRDSLARLREIATERQFSEAIKKLAERRGHPKAEARRLEAWERKQRSSR